MRRGANGEGMFSKRFASKRFGIGTAERVFDHDKRISGY
jgi:hypothetical protein